MPQDIWLYNYAVKLFKARKDFLKNGIWNPPMDEPPKDLIGCQSIRDMIHCNSGALNFKAEIPEIPEKGLEKLKWYKQVEDIMLHTNNDNKTLNDSYL